ncbi:hypothetical protein G4B88_026083 [Cannabis sativa]|uniref:acetyl-CoA C-acyltransferase n=1 Tax=Cannabis sativa TaxID=3483 RepID=A0A7J6DPF0_CANSA|nr:hypothetical protein G4B88_026083 [Cannabis sativa]
MALNKSDKLFDPMINEFHGPSGRWIEQEPNPVSTLGKNMNNNVSVQTGEEFSKVFLQDRLPARRVASVTDTVQEREKRVGFIGYENSLPGYEDLSRVLGLTRMDSENASETPDFVSAKGSLREIDVEAYADRLNRNNKKENGETGHGGLRKVVSDQNCDRTGGVTVIPSYKSESPSSNNFNGSEVLDGSQSGKIKFLCSFGGKILPRPSDGEDLDALISVSSDEDLQNMIEEYHGIEKQDGSQRLRIFLIPLGESEGTSSLDASTIKDNNPDYQYVAAVNGMVDPVSLKSVGGQSLASEANQLGVKNSPFTLETNIDSTALHDSKYSESQKINVSPTHSPPFSPIQCHQDSKSAKIQAQSNTACVNPSPEGVNLMMYDQPTVSHSEQLHGGHFQDHDFMNGFTSPIAADRNDGDFVGFSHDRPISKERVFHSEKPGSRLNDPTGLLSDCSDPHLGMSHAFSDSQLQESGRRSAYCSQEGTSPSSPLSFAKAQLSLQLNSGTLQENPSQLHDNINVINPQVQKNLMDSESVAVQRIILPNFSLSSELMACNEANPKCGTGDIDGNLLTVKDEIGSSNFSMPNQSVLAVDCKNELDSTNPVQDPLFTIGSQERTPSSSSVGLIPLVDDLVVPPKNNHHCDQNIAELFSMSQTSSNDHKNVLIGTADVQGNNVFGTNNYDASRLFPGAKQHYPKEDPLGDLLAGFSVDPYYVSLHNLLLITLQNPTQGTAVNQEINFGDSTDVESNSEGIKLTQTEPTGNDNNQASSMAQYLMGETVVDDSPTATEVDSIVPESESEDGKADEDRNDLFSDAMIAEMEASIYGLQYSFLLHLFVLCLMLLLNECPNSNVQIIRNSDLEELRELGSGTYGTVFHGKWRGTDVAIKRIKKSCFAGRSSEQERLTKDFWREAQILSNLHHPNVLAFYGVVPDGAGGTLATVTEFMVNGSLRHVLLKKDRSLDRRRKLIIAMDAAFGMEYLHSKNIVHFDLKCDNLLVNLRDPHRPICKVGDFGLSRIKRNTLVSGGVRGTLPWMAPELLNGSSSRVSEKVDVFSFGISMWEILTGEEPYANMHCGAIIGGIVKNTLRPPIPERCDPDWRRLMEECWSPEPEYRPSFTEITNRLRSMSIALQAKAQSNPAKVPISPRPPLAKASVCAAGDSAAYHRAPAFGDDIVIVAAYRTPIFVLKAVVEKTNLDPSEVGDIVVGTVLPPGSQRATECRMAAIYAGFPDTVPIRTVNRQCSSGLQAVADVAASIKSGFYDIGIGAGLECMTVDNITRVRNMNPRQVDNFAQARDCLLPMGITSENVAERYGITRQEQDQAAVNSHRRAAAATASGKFKDEIIPVSTKIVDPKTGQEKRVTISVDDGIRPNTDLSTLAKLKPAFKNDGSTTAGNSSQVSDGAGAVLLMKRSLAMQKGLPILGVFRSFSAVGVDPAVMGIGPSVAIPAAVKSAGLELDNIDLFEINEARDFFFFFAFASQYVYCIKKLELDPEKVNVNGGAIAFGHPLGATGARCVATLLNEMKRRGKDCRFGVVSMCIGTGMGAAAVLERGDSVDELCNARAAHS